MTADLIVSCPGNFLISDHGRGLFFLLTVFTLFYGWLLGKPLYMMPQTVGPLHRPREQRLIRWLLQKMRLVLVRDETSLEMIRKLGLPPSGAHLLPDVAFLYRRGADLGPLLDLATDHERLKRPLIGITVINWRGHDPLHAQPDVYESAIAGAVSHFLARYGGSAIFFPQVCGPSEAEDDRPPSRRIARKIRQGGHAAYAIEYEMTPEQLQAAYGQMDIFLGTRLHSNIFAMNAGTPVVAIAYQYKTYGVMGMLGLLDQVIGIDEISEQDLTTRLAGLWEERAVARAHLQNIMPDLQGRARSAAEQIRADFTSFLPHRS
jgi:colanic acid/amylovoran biosynthesis protein